MKSKSISTVTKSFPTRNILMYVGIQIGLGALFALLSLENSSALKSLFISFENNLSTFRTAFITSQTPVASKTYLTIWWLAIIPWGLFWFYRFAGGFKPVSSSAFKLSTVKLMGLLLLAIGLGYMFISLLSFHDHSNYFLRDKLNSGSRASIVPLLLSGGPLSMSIWLSISSLMICLCTSGFFMFFRLLINNLFGGKNL